MATKFILAGGYIFKSKVVGKDFAEEIVKGHGESPKILICAFARLQESWDQIFEAESESFRIALPEKKPQLMLADLNSFSEQVKWADALYFRGGSSEALVSALTEDMTWTEYLNNKTVAGSSAGADAISKYYFGLDKLEVREGLGLLPIKVIPHFKSDYLGREFDWDNALKDLESFKEPLELFALHEGEFKLVEK